MDRTHLVPRALLAVSLLAFASTAAGAPRPETPAFPATPPAKAPDAVLLDGAKAQIHGPVLATARAELPGGAAALLVAWKGPGRDAVTFDLVVIAADAAAGYAIAGHDEVRTGPVYGAPTLALAADRPQVAAGAVTATVGWKAADGSTEEQQVLYRYGGGRLARLLALPPARTFPPGAGRPSTFRELSALSTGSGGYRDLLVRERTASCAAVDDCAEDVDVASWRFDGVRYAARPYAVPFVEKISASSELASPGGIEDHTAAAALDGRADTSWCEGAPGPGWFQKLDLTFVPAQRVTAVSIVPGFGTGDAFKETTRPRRVRLLLPDGRKVEADLADAPKAQRIALPEGERVFGMTIVIVDVYKGKREDACIAEVIPEVEP